MRMKTTTCSSRNTTIGLFTLLLHCLERQRAVPTTVQSSIANSGRIFVWTTTFRIHCGCPGCKRYCCLLLLLLVVLVVVVMMMTHLLSARWLICRRFDITSYTRRQHELNHSKVCRQKRQQWKILHDQESVFAWPISTAFSAKGQPRQRFVAKC